MHNHKGAYVLTCKHTHTYIRTYILSSAIHTLSDETHLSCPDKLLTPPSCLLLSPSCSTSPFSLSLICAPTLSCSPNSLSLHSQLCPPPRYIFITSDLSSPHCPITPTPVVILTITYVLCPNNTQFPHPLLPPTHFYNQLQNLTDLSKPPSSSSLPIHH